MARRLPYRTAIAACFALCLAPALSARAAVAQPEPVAFHVFGLVADPGAYTWSEGVTVKGAVALAGGYTADGSSDGLEIQRMVDEKLVSTVASEDDLVLADDVVMVRGEPFRPPGREA
jgi:protein involved in polysaccharide export with SLBB domain